MQTIFQIIFPLGFYRNIQFIRKTFSEIANNLLIPWLALGELSV